MVSVIFVSSQHPSLAVLAAACLNEMAFAGLARGSAAVPDGHSETPPLDSGVREFLRCERIRVDDTCVSGLDRETLRAAELVIAIGEIADVDLRAHELWMLPNATRSASDARDLCSALRDRVWQLVA